MKRLFAILLVLSSFNVYSQGFVTAKDIHVDLTGFVRNDFIIDTRRNVDACDHLLEMFPKKPEYDANGEDINAQPSAHFLNIFTRFGTRFSGVEIGSAKIGAYVEVDFTGGTATNSLRFRHAYTQFDWTKTKLLFGRTWHPTFIEKVYPSTLNENTGVPFQVFNRSPQLRLTHNLTDNLDFIAAAVYQYKYANSGPDGKTYRYQRDAMIPNLHAQLQYDNNGLVLGAAFDWKVLKPRTSTTGTSGTYVTDETISSMAALAYLKYAKEKFLLKAKTMYGQNVCESLLPGGYAVASLDEQTGFETYTPSNSVYNWINLVYGSKWKTGIFLGYMKNLGFSDDPVGQIFGFAPDIDNGYRVSPFVSYNYKTFTLGWEMSLTTVAYGEIDRMDKGKVKNPENVSNFRNMISVIYKF